MMLQLILLLTLILLQLISSRATINLIFLLLVTRVVARPHNLLGTRASKVNNSASKRSGGIQQDYYSCIQSSQPNFDKFQYINIGLWNKKDELKFYKQTNDNYVSQSLVENMFGQKYDIVPVNSIKNIMEQQGHTKIYLLKLDIASAEIETVNQMLDDKIYPTYVLVEFDLLLKKKDPKNTTRQLVNRMISKENYKIIKDDNLNITFIKP